MAPGLNQNPVGDLPSRRFRIAPAASRRVEHASHEIARAIMLAFVLTAEASPALAKERTYAISHDLLESDATHFEKHPHSILP